MPYFKTENSNAENIKYDNTKSVKEAIDEIKASSSSNPTASSVTFDNANTGLNATNVQDAVTELNGKLDWFDIKSISSRYTAVGTNAIAEICRMSLTPGTWLLLGFVDGNKSKDIVYNNSIFRGSLANHCQTIRSYLSSGGGNVNVYPITIQTNTDIILGTYDDSSLKDIELYGRLHAIRLLKL